MKKVYFNVFFLFLINYFPLFSQSTDQLFNKNLLEIGVGVGLSHPNYFAATGLLHLDFTYNYRNFSYGWSFHQHIFGFGLDHPGRSGDQLTFGNKRLHQIRATKAVIGYSPTVNDFQSVFGIGIGYYFRARRYRGFYNTDGDFIETASFRKDYKVGLVIRTGARYKRLTTYLELNFLPRYLSDVSLSNHANIIIIRRFGWGSLYKPKRKRYLRNYKNRKKEGQINFGVLFSHPIHPKYRAGSTRWFIEVKTASQQKFDVGIRYEHHGQPSGYDETLIRFVSRGSSTWIRAENFSRQVFNVQIKVVKTFIYQNRFQLHYDIGLGLFQIINADNHQFGSLPTASKVRGTLGGSLALGYQYGPLFGQISLNAAVQHLPIMLNFGIGYSLGIKKKSKSKPMN